MADYVKVIGWAIERFSIPVNSPIIAFGGSYPGDLVTYMRVAYPSVIDAGLASSAPLLYHTGMVPGGGFFRVSRKYLHSLILSRWPQLILVRKTRIVQIL